MGLTISAFRAYTMAIMDKKIARRAFMRLLPAAPLMAKEAASTAAAEATQASGVSVLGRRHRYFPDHRSGQKIEGALVKLLRDGKRIPALRAKQWRLQAKREARILDPDIASMRSLSLSKKIAMQEERNYERAIQDHLERHDDMDAWKVFTKGLGLDPDEDEVVGW